MQDVGSRCTSTVVLKMPVICAMVQIFTPRPATTSSCGRSVFLRGHFCEAAEARVAFEALPSSIEFGGPLFHCAVDGAPCAYVSTWSLWMPAWDRPSREKYSIPERAFTFFVLARLCGLPPGRGCHRKTVLSAHMCRES